MVLTWLAIAASILMGTAGVLVFVFAVKRDYFRDIEDAKYQVFWSDVDELVSASETEATTLQESGGQESAGKEQINGHE